MNIYLIDGNSYVYRAFYAIKGLSNSKGFPTNAIYGFTNMILKIIREKKPDGIAVAFDTPELTERHRIFRDYKANRPETPSDLVMQLPFIRQVITGFNIRIFEMPGYEADDIIGTIAKKTSGKNINVYIVTADKDMLQLVDEHIKIYDPVKDRMLDAEYVKEKFGVGPERVTEFMALTGDATDNIPGIKGVGEKTARELLTEVASLDELLLHPEKIKKLKLRSMISEHTDIVRLSQKLATIDTQVPAEIDLDDFAVREPDWLLLLPLFREFEFVSLMKLAPSGAQSERKHDTIDTIDALKEFVSTVRNDFAFDTEATGINPLTDSLVGIALCNDKERACYIPVAHDTLPGQAAKQADKADVLEILAPLFSNSEIAKTGHNLKYDIMLLGQEGIDIKGALYDTMIAAYLLNPNKANHSLDEVSLEYLSKRKKSFVEVLKKRKTFAEVPVDEAAPYAAEDAALSYELKEVLFRKLHENRLAGIYSEIEMPLINVLIEMEKAGIRIDAELLNHLSGTLSAEIENIQKRIYFFAGREFNINSPKQLAGILFHDLGLSPLKKTKTGFSTGMDVLEELAGLHDLPREILDYRSLNKLKTTYLDVLPALVNPNTGRVHTSFNQTVTATGRLSSTNPNLQNIPVKGEWGKRIREAFIAEEGNLLISADYSQVELRILAHLSNDKGLMTAFRDGLDIHTRTASELYGVPFDSVTEEMRRAAKTVNFGVIYGISAFGLSETLKIERKDAEKYIKQYFDRHPGVRDYTAGVIAEAKEKGVVTTIMGRTRPVPELKSQNRSIRQQGERLAVNSPIQGSAADIIKVAMINISRRLRKDNLRARMILQVHDELLFELPESELDAVSRMVKEEMEGAVTLSVPLKVDIGSGKNWAEAH